MIRRKFGLCWTVAAAAILTICAAPTRADEWHKTYQISTKPDLRVTTNDARIEITTSESKQIVARVETMGWSIGDNGVRISEQQTGDRVEIDVHIPNLHWSWGRRSVAVRLEIPREGALNVRTGDGSVSVTPFSGQVDIHSGDGNITASGLKGDIRLDTGDGHITADSLDGRLLASSGDGRMELDGRFDALEARTSDGSITARVRNGSKMSSGWSLRSGDGSIRVALPQDFQAELEVHTGDGRIDSELPITMQGSWSRNDLHGTLNGGGPVFSIHTGDGSIHLERM